MNLPWVVDWMAMAGLGIGAVVAMTGVGGGSLMTPLSNSVFKLNPAVAIGADLRGQPTLPLMVVAGVVLGLLVSLSSIGAGALGATRGHVDWTLLVGLLIGSSTGIWLGAQLNKSIRERLVRALLCISPATAGLKVIH